MVGLIYGYGWLIGLKSAKATCDDVTSPACGPSTIVGSVFMSVGNMWLLLLILMLFMFVVETFVVKTLYKEVGLPLASDNAFHLIFSWMKNPRVLVVLSLSLFVTLALGTIYGKWMEVRNTPPEERKNAIQNVYVFNLVVVAMLVVAQLWLPG
jgi:hypothetical protein